MSARGNSTWGGLEVSQGTACVRLQHGGQVLDMPLKASPTVSPGVGGSQELSVGSKVEGWVEKPSTQGDKRMGKWLGKSFWEDDLRVLAAPQLTRNQVVCGSAHLSLENKGGKACV